MFEPVGFIASFDDVAVMGDAVEHGSRHLGIGTDLHPEMDPMGGDRNWTKAFVGELIPVFPFPDRLWCNIVLPGKIHLLTITLSLDLSTQLWCCTGLWMDDHGVASSCFCLSQSFNIWRVRNKG